MKGLVDRKDSSVTKSDDCDGCRMLVNIILLKDGRISMKNTSAS